MKNSVIIVPYRDREQHLLAFINHMHNGAYKDIPICIVEQDEHLPFNRAKLLNIGFLENQEFDRFIFHDVDMLPINVNYDAGNTTQVTQLASSSIQLVDYLGGVTKFTKTAFLKSGGYNNEYFHRAEDNEMRFNLKRLHMTVETRPGLFKVLSHARKGPEFDPALWHKAQQKRIVQNNLKTCIYSMVDTKQHGNVKHITVTL